MKYIFVVGAPGSKWSSVVKNIYFSPDIDRSDYSEDRKYAHHAGVMHIGAYFAYYSVEPGVTYTMGKATAKVGFRFRDSFTEVNEDQTRTWRVGLAYAVTDKDTVGVRYDRVRGDSNNHSYNFAYTRSF